MTEREIYDAYLEAERLRNEPAFQHALTETRKEALEALATIDPVDTDKVRDAQATVRAIDGITTQIANSIIRWKALGKQEPQD